MFKLKTECWNRILLVTQATLVLLIAGCGASLAGASG